MMELRIERIYPGIWKITLGEPEAATPVKLRHIAPAGEALAALPRRWTAPSQRRQSPGVKRARLHRAPAFRRG